MKEPDIEINGWQCTPAMAMTIRVALNSFAMELEANGLGDDEHGKAMKAGYLARAREVNDLMAKAR